MKSPKIHRTPLYRAKAAYSNMLARCGNKNGKNAAYQFVEVRFSKEEWLEWAVPEYEKFIEEHGDLVSPSVSRFNDEGHYELGNLEIILFSKNREYFHENADLNSLRQDGSKRCSRCQLCKTKDDFGLNKKRKDGLDHWCKTCKKDFYNNNKEEINKKKREKRKRLGSSVV